MHQIQNYFIGGHLWWQTKVLKVLWSTNFKTAIFLGDMKILSNWIGILICRIRRKQVAFWTHGIYGNEKGLKKAIDDFYCDLAQCRGSSSLSENTTNKDNEKQHRHRNEYCNFNKG